MDAYYAIYRQEDLVQNGINALAYFTSNKGAKTVLSLPNDTGMTEEEKKAATSQFSWVKDYVDKVNAAVDLDDMVYVAIIKKKIFGWCGFEIVTGDNGTPTRLLARRVARANRLGGIGLIPEVDWDTFELKGFSYNGKPEAFTPDEILWFTNNEIDDDWAGISEIESVKHYVETKQYIIQEALKESAKSMWAPFVILQVDTSTAATDNEAEVMIDAVLEQVKPGVPIGVNQMVTPTVVDVNPRIQGLIASLSYLDQAIIGNTRVPRFLLGREEQFNRATAFAEGQLFLNGPVMAEQLKMKRELENQWYPKLVETAFKQKGMEYDPDNPPVTVKHEFNPVTMEDWAELVNQYLALFQGKVVNRATVLDKLGLDPNMPLDEVPGGPPTPSEGDPGVFPAIPPRDITQQIQPRGSPGGQPAAPPAGGKPTKAATSVKKP